MDLLFLRAEVDSLRKHVGENAEPWGRELIQAFLRSKGR